MFPWSIIHLIPPNPGWEGYLSLKDEPTRCEKCKYTGCACPFKYFTEKERRKCKNYEMSGWYK
jgi:hypothetical protein